MKKVGRPTKYKRIYCKKIVEHFNIEPNYVKNEQFFDKKGALIKEKNTILANDFPTIEGFCIKIGVNKSTLHRWVQTKEEFRNAYKRGKDLQLNILIQNTLKGFYNHRIATFIAKNCFGWK